MDQLYFLGYSFSILETEGAARRPHLGTRLVAAMGRGLRRRFGAALRGTRTASRRALRAL